VNEDRNLRDKCAVVTGATAGIGFFTARRLARRGATVVITGRDPVRGQEAAEKLSQAAGHERVEFVAVDHSTVVGNLRLAEELRPGSSGVDFLINNVGGLIPSRALSDDGIELTLALNFMAPFVLTGSLLPMMLERGSARVVNVVSSAFKMAKRDPFDDLLCERSYVPLQVLARAKLLAIVWTAALADEYRGGALSAVAVNPGTAWTPGTEALTRDTIPAWRYIWPVVRLFQRRADPDRAGSACEVVALAPASEIRDRWFDRTKPHALPGKVVAPALREQVLALGRRLLDEARERGNADRQKEQPPPRIA
jgi:NAD(P)-dependent dehydrogenase (short-subunit alcohol dehydrogenase family)